MTHNFVTAEPTLIVINASNAAETIWKSSWDSSTAKSELLILSTAKKGKILPRTGHEGPDGE